MGVASDLLLLRTKTLLAADTVSLDATPRPKVRLFTASTVVTPSSPIDQFTPPTFDGYDDLQSDSITSYRDSLTNDWLLQLTRSDGWLFESSGSNTVSETIVGFVVTDGSATPTTWYWAENFAPPVPITGPSQGIPIDPTLRINAAALS